MTARELLRRHRLPLSCAVVLALLGAGVALAAPLAVAQATDAALGGDERGVVRAALALVAVAVVAAAARWTGVRLQARVAETVLHDLRVAAAEQTAQLSVIDLGGSRQGDVLQRLGDDIAVLGIAAREAVPESVRALALLLLGAVGVLALHPLLALAAVVWLPVVAIALLRFRRRADPVYARERSDAAAVSSALVETAEAAGTIVRFRAQEPQIGSVSVRAEALSATQLEGMRARNRLYPVLEAVEGATVITVLLAGAALVDAGRIGIGAVAGATVAAGALLGPIEVLVGWLDELLAGRPALRRVLELVRRPASPTPPAVPVPLPGRGRLELRDVRFAYGDGPDVLRGIDLVVSPGERVAVTGPSGAGKSTLARIACRLEDPTSGDVLLGGVQLSDADMQELRRRVAHVPQLGRLLGPTLLDDVRLGRPEATHAEVRAAFDTIGVGDWCDGLPAGLATPTPGGLSAGERQMVALARLVLLDPAVVVLDEATSALDDELDARVDAAVAAALGGRAVLILAHRSSTAAAADRRVVLKDGRLVAAETEGHRGATGTTPCRHG